MIVQWADGKIHTPIKWVITDTHFGHKAIMQFCGRSYDYEDQIVEGWKATVGPTDCIVHLGDVTLCKSDLERKWHEVISSLPGYKILIRGNHDKRTNTWYKNHGWDVACGYLKVSYLDKSIILTHEPMLELPRNYDLNIHGHLHNTTHRQGIKSDRHLLVALEYTGYKPLDFKEIVRKKLNI